MSERRPQIRLLLADDHTLVRRGIARIIGAEPDFEVVGEASDGEEAVAHALALRPDVVLMDIEMPGLSGIEATRQIIAQTDSVGVLVLTIYDVDDLLFEGLQAGASGYLLKGADVDELVHAVRTVAAGEVYVTPRMAKKLVGDYLHRLRVGEGGDEFASLTTRERELLPLLADDYSNDELAQRLQISPFTVRTHRQRVMQKLNLHSKSELLRYALRRGLLTLDE